MQYNLDLEAHHHERQQNEQKIKQNLLNIRTKLRQEVSLKFDIGQFLQSSEAYKSKKAKKLLSPIYEQEIAVYP